ncbi:hypothetical protein SAMN06265365_114102 [Tistlia consotensis]|uniref:Outer membrane surface antigen n=1 Tax=Tistlia consotensis USBA 355 TaxID=560819 RepID=A0A1Y6BA09_9PROT|nr:hypothetical protein [Tistlia consotensis]SME99291.1 hypothetical protein SAMN05428998_102261 [Tistlia consotensis USBA 355]SNR77134.1 hypothetical protein SAMN06265365_114102 [Tistlia consotensis]
MRKCLPLLALLLLLSACASEAKYQSMLDGWVGASEHDLIQAWGPPDSSYQNDEAKYLTWKRQYQNYMPGTPPSYVTHSVGNQVYTTPIGGSPGYLFSSSCKTTFTVIDDRVTGWRVEGNACRM